MEQDLVVKLGRQFGTAPTRRPQGCPVSRVEQTGDQLSLQVTLQKFLLVVCEQLVAVQAVGEGGEASARHAGDDVDLVEQARSVAPRSNDLGAPQKLKDSVRECGGARPAARKRKDDQVVLVLEMRFTRLIPVPSVRVGLGDRRIDRAGGATSQQK